MLVFGGVLLIGAPFKTRYIYGESMGLSTIIIIVPKKNPLKRPAKYHSPWIAKEKLSNYVKTFFCLELQTTRFLMVVSIG